MRPNLWGLYLRLSIGAVLVLLYLLCARKQQTLQAYARAEQSQPYGRYTANQVLERSRPLCQAIDARAGNLTLSAERLPFAGGQRLWRVACLDAAGNCMVHLTWNADTGQICQAGHWMPPRDQQRAFRARRGDVEYSARQWLYALGMAARTDDCRLRTVQRKSISGYWQTQWQVNGSPTTVIIDGSGQLVMAMHFVLPSHPIHAVSSL